MRKRRELTGLSDVPTHDLRCPDWSQGGWPALRVWLDNLVGLIRDRELSYWAIGHELASRREVDDA